ncbi:hypothetical protein COE15_10265 [Bacillus cereus]|nr:hypothetical protein CN288_09915 [Bacillus sp. AFS023182]PGY01916.1 hypothetical protein COE15_10265 [Bacillus cereus]
MQFTQVDHSTSIAVTITFMIAKKQRVCCYKALTMQKQLLQILSVYCICLYNLSIQQKKMSY